MNPVLYTPVIRNAAYLKEFEWIELFVRSCKSDLEPSLAQETIAYSNALNEFEKGNFEKSLKYVY